jgi:hypothetical protein
MSNQVPSYNHGGVNDGVPSGPIIYPTPTVSSNNSASNPVPSNVVVL